VCLFYICTVYGYVIRTRRCWQLNGTNLPNVEKTAHLSIQRSKTDKDTIENTVIENSTKARRTAYSIMSAGFHVNNGLDPSSCIHIMKTYVVPTLLYGLEVITPDKKNLEKLEKFHERMVKQIISLPQNAPDIVPYIISDFVCLYNYEFGLSLCKIVRSSVILLLPLFSIIIFCSLTPL
jgi:hypothetical protein